MLSRPERPAPLPHDAQGKAWRLTRVAVLLCALTLAIPCAAQKLKLLIQSSPLAGFQFHAGEALWSRLKEGDRLTLIRESENPHDRRAVRVEWQGVKLGYLPRVENDAVSVEMDRGAQVEARIAKLSQHPDPWRRILIEVFLVL